MKVVRKTVILDLNKPEEELLKELDKDARWGVNRAKREGLVIEEDKGLDEFYPIYLKEMKKYKITPYSLESIKRDKLVFIGCRKEGKLIAGIVMVLDKETGLPKIHYHSSLEEYHKLQPNDLLYWSCILWAKNKGYEKLDFGGYALNPRGNIVGVNKYKEKWGKVVSEEIDLPFLEAMRFRLITNVKFTQWLILNLRFWRNNMRHLYETKQDKKES
jgi:lipid II:glycine glycyltransferase (peptidoglycan interpeptide bridge formation enzyme)